MKKLPLYLSLFTASCALNTIPQETISNPKCLNTHRLEVFQTTDDITLVYLRYCVDADPECRSGSIRQENGRLYAIKTAGWATKEHLYDGSIFGFADGECPVLDGTYSYTNTMGAKTTVQQITIIHDAQIPNPEYKTWKEQQDKKTENQNQSEK